MQYTGNANKFIWYILMPTIFMFYASFLFWSGTTGTQNDRDWYAAAHRVNMIELDEWMIKEKTAQILSRL